MLMMAGALAPLEVGTSSCSIFASQMVDPFSRGERIGRGQKNADERGTNGQPQHIYHHSERTTKKEGEKGRKKKKKEKKKMKLII